MFSTIEKMRKYDIRERSEAPAYTEAAVRMYTMGYGTAPLNAEVPTGDLSTILEGEREVETTLRIRVSGYGRRNVSVRVLPVEAGASVDSPRTVKLRVPGCGSAPTTMSFARA